MPKLSLRPDGPQAPPSRRLPQTPEPTNMLHHISFAVTDIERAASFYDPTLAALGYVRVFEDLRPGESGQAIGYGLEGQGDGFCIKQASASSASPGHGFHLAFAAPSRRSVHEFHQHALQHGGQDNGGPGPRPGYGPNYYACFVIDPDGHHLEAVINSPA